jgi:hypothetical protein
MEANAEKKKSFHLKYQDEFVFLRVKDENFFWHSGNDISVHQNKEVRAPISCIF